MNVFHQMLLAALQPYVDRLGLKWPFDVKVDSVINEAYVIVQPPRLRTHLMVVHPRTMSDYRPAMPLLVKGICRAHLGETLHPIFTSVIWHEPTRWQADQVHLLQNVVNRILGVWANDVRQAHWPRLAGEEIDWYWNQTKKIRPGATPEFFKQLKARLETAEACSVSTRHLRSEKNVSGLTKALDENQRVDHQSISGFFASLEQLERHDLSRALEQYEKAVFELLVLLGESLRVKLVYTDDMYRWMVIEEERK